MLSRVADAIYWMQRYRERTENVARLIDVNLFLAIDAPGEEFQQWEPIINATGDKSLFLQFYNEATESNTIQFLTFDLNNPNSILNCIHRSRENARSIREIITSEMWNELNTLYIYVREMATSLPRKTKPMFDFYAHVRRSCQLFTGIMDTTMSHSEAWHFGRLGNLIERADQSSRILDVKYYILLPSVEHVGTPYDDILWSAVLQSVSGLEMYRKRFQELHHSNVIDFFILDPDFPRSIKSCMIRSQESLKKIAAGQNQTDTEPMKLINALCVELNETNVYDIVKLGLHEYLDQIQSKLSRISESIYQTYFATRLQSEQVFAQSQLLNTQSDTE